jgi:hypothetical protein
LPESELLETIKLLHSLDAPFTDELNSIENPHNMIIKLLNFMTISFIGRNDPLLLWIVKNWKQVFFQSSDQEKAQLILTVERYLPSPIDK